VISVDDASPMLKNAEDNVRLRDSYVAEDLESMA
jgi:hypothetical protein